jgi:hypothetical protein
MQIAFENISPMPDFKQLPLRIEHSTSRTSAAVRLMMLAPLLALLAAPLMIIAASAAEPTAISIMLDNPASAAKAILGLAAWSALILWPLKRVIGRLGVSRTIEITEGTVTVVDQSPFRSRTWSAALGSYAGIAHHIRSSLSGNRHELFLVHPDRAKSTLIAAADRISQDTLENAKRLLNLPEVPARQLYSRA